jgi:glycosyltransferase involved in cell wall biosynthesis
MKCYDSLLKQTYQNYKAILVNDGSGDSTARLLRNINRLTDKVETFSYSSNEGATKRRYDAIKNSNADKDTIILLLGLDDYLLPNALEEIKKQYDAGVWMTYGNWINQKGIGLPEDFDLFFDEETHNDRSYRKVKYRSTAPNTFKRFLFDNIPESDFKLNGKWFDTTTESELMFSCLEMCGKERIGVITKPIYVYNQNLPNGTLRRLGAEYKRRVYNQVIARPKKNLLRLAE